MAFRSVSKTNSFLPIRLTTTDDINSTMKKAQGNSAKRIRTQLEVKIDKFTVIERDDLVIGCAALEPTDKVETGELSCLVNTRTWSA